MMDGMLDGGHGAYVNRAYLEYKCRDGLTMVGFKL
jgi:hypothetical protein